MKTINDIHADHRVALVKPIQAAWNITRIAHQNTAFDLGTEYQNAAAIVLADHTDETTAEEINQRCRDIIVDRMLLVSSKDARPALPSREVLMARLIDVEAALMGFNHKRLSELLLEYQRAQ